MKKAQLLAKEKLLKYLGDPANEFITRQRLSTEVLGYKSSNQLNCLFTSAQIKDIEKEALDMRRARYAPHISDVDMALINSAKSGDTQAAKLVYQRFEGWSEKQIKEIEGNLGVTLDTLTDDELQAQIDALLKDK